jgi:hypothetical protein
MPRRVDVVGVGLVEFPDGMSDDEIAAAIEGEEPPKPQSQPNVAAKAAVLNGGRPPVALERPGFLKRAASFVGDLQEVATGNAIATVTGLAESVPQMGAAAVDVMADTFTAGPLRRAVKAARGQDPGAMPMPVTDRVTEVADKAEAGLRSAAGVTTPRNFADKTSRFLGGIPDPVAPAVAIATKGRPVANAAFDAAEYVAENVAKRELARTGGVASFPERASTFLKEVKTKLVDMASPIEDTIRAAAERSGISFKPSEDITNQIDRVMRAPTLAGQFVKDAGFDAVIREAPDLDMLDEYLIARHGRTLAANDIETGRDLGRDELLLRDAAAQYEPIAQKVTEYSNRVLDYAVESGLVSSELAAKLKAAYPDYVPMKRVFGVMEEQPGGGVGSGKGLASLSGQSLVKKIQGSEREIESPIESLLAKTYDAFAQGEKNKAARRLVEVGQALPDNPLGLSPVRLAKNVERRGEILGELKELGKAQRPARRRAGTAGRHLRSAARSLKNQLDNVQSKIFETLEESDDAWNEARAAAADFDPSGAIDEVLERSVGRERRIAELGDRVHRTQTAIAESAQRQDELFAHAQAMAEQGASPREIARVLDEGLRNERRMVGLEAAADKADQAFDFESADVWEDIIEGGIAQAERTIERAMRRGRTAEKRLYFLEQWREAVENGTTAQRKAAIADTLNRLKDEIAGRSDDTKALRSELFSLKDKKASPGDPTISFLNEGVRETWKVNKDIAHAAKLLDEQRMNILGQILAIPVRIAKIGITGINIPFIASNLVRDQLTSLINSNRALATSIANPINFTKAFFEAIRHGDLYQEMVRMGGGGTSFDIARTQVRETVGAIRSRRSVGSRVAFAISHPSRLLRAAEDFISRAEELTRIQQYRGTREALLREGMPLQEAQVAAARAARENSVNFARRGEWGTVINSAFLYLNAGIQGSRTLLRAIRRDPKGTSAKIAATVFLPVMTAAAWNMSDPKRREAYEDIAEFERENNLIIVPDNPEKDERGRWKVIKIPLAQGLNSLSSLPRRAVEQAFQRDPDRAYDIADALIGTVSPVDPSSGAIVSTLTPQLARPWVELQANKNLFTGRDIVPRGLQDEAPEDQVRKGTSGTARMIADPLDASPIAVEHATRAVFGGVGSQALNASDRVLAAAGKIPESQIGGEDPIEATSRRFTRAFGGEKERRRKDRKKKKRSESR